MSRVSCRINLVSMGREAGLFQLKPGRNAMSRMCSLVVWLVENHVCLPAVCHIGRGGRDGFCRMLSWHWDQARANCGIVGWKKQHGKQLVPRWDGTEYPPLEKVTH